VPKNKGKLVYMGIPYFSGLIFGLPKIKKTASFTPEGEQSGAKLEKEQLGFLPDLEKPSGFDHPQL
jgi:hypothetical protein